MGAGTTVRVRSAIGALLFAFAIGFTASARAQTASPELAQLRHQLALRYLEPAPHLALAKFFWSRGDRLQAFYNLEYARRGRFREAEFDAAFVRAFGSPPIEEKAGLAVFNKGVALQNAGNLKEAEEHFIRAAELAPRSVHIQSWVGRFFFKVKRNDELALKYYLNAYFLTPHAYETEFVESRIRKINYEAADTRYRWLSAQGTPLAQILQDRNPTVVVLAMERLANDWTLENLKLLLKYLEHDDEQVRWQASQAIAKNADRSFDPTLQALLRDNDLRKRGLAAYIAARVWKQESYPILRQMLREQAQLLRFDALSALAIDDSREARSILQDHRRSETNPTLLELIDKTLRP